MKSILIYNNIVMNNNNNKISLVIEEKEVSFSSKSDAIRKLYNKYNFTKVEISKMLNIRYQFVRNVLTNEENNKILARIKNEQKDEVEE